jgi:uncharacterized SAM-binding protein YcdF (DUF218 family)
VLRRGCSCLPTLLLAVLLAAGVYIFRGPILTAAGQFLIADEPPRKVDLIVSLAGDEFGLRALTAGKLVKEGDAPYALISGVPGLLMNEADELIRFAELHGYPGSYFRPFRHTSDSTKSESAALAADLKTRGVHSILLVTSNYHSRRAGEIMRRAAPWLEVHTVAAPDRYFSANGWWKTRSGQRTFLYEWLKTFSAWLGY